MEKNPAVLVADGQSIGGEVIRDYDYVAVAPSHIAGCERGALLDSATCYAGQSAADVFEIPVLAVQAIGVDVPTAQRIAVGGAVGREGLP